MCSQGDKGLRRVTVDKEEGKFPSLSKDLRRGNRAGILKAQHHRIDSLYMYREVPGDRTGRKAVGS